MNDVERVLQQRNIGGRVRIKVSEGELDDSWRIDDTTVSLAESAGTSGFRLLANLEDVAFKPTTNSAALLYTQAT